MSAAELLRGLDRDATAGPWAWDNRGYKCDDIQVGVAASLDGKLLSGPLSDDVEGIVYVEPVATSVERVTDARLVVTTRNLLPLLAGLVEALGDFMDPEKEDDVDANYQRVERAYAALNAAAAKEAS